MLACLAGTRLGVDPQWGGGDQSIFKFAKLDTILLQ